MRCILILTENNFSSLLIAVGQGADTRALSSRSNGLSTILSNLTDSGGQLILREQFTGGLQKYSLRDLKNTDYRIGKIQFTG